MIKYWYENGRYAPLLLCDTCGKRIENSGMGAAVHANGREEGEYLDVLHVHKGQCHDKAEADLGGTSSVGWEELNVHLLHLTHNAGFTLEQAKELRELRDELEL